MTEKQKTATRHPTVDEMLGKAMEGERISANEIFVYLSSVNPSLRQIIMESIHDYADINIWDKLLRSMALQEWDGLSDLIRFQNQPAAERIDRTIVELFTAEDSQQEGEVKEALLMENLGAPTAAVRYAAGFLLGLRGNIEAVPSLTEAIEEGEEKWKIRAVEALLHLKHASVGPPLLTALAMGRGKIHLAAGRALNNLGGIVEQTWLDALDHANSHVRWHAARGLGNLGEARYAAVIAEGLADENRAVRWASADVLAKLGRAGVPATLNAITQLNLNEQTRRAVYHALHGISSNKLQTQLAPLLDALNGSIANIKAPPIAQKLLLDWDYDQ